MFGNTHNLPHSKDHRELTFWVLFAICNENTDTISKSTDKVGQTFSALNSNWKARMLQSSIN